MQYYVDIIKIFRQISEYEEYGLSEVISWDNLHVDNQSHSCNWSETGGVMTFEECHLSTCHCHAQNTNAALDKLKEDYDHAEE